MFDFIYDKTLVGERIRVKRQALRLSQEALAEKVEKSLRMVADVERGAAGMSMETLFAMCRVLKATPNELLLPDGNEKERDELAWLVQALANSPDHVRETAIDIVRAYLRSV